jgi:hypothetical protein
LLVCALFAPAALCGQTSLVNSNVYVGFLDDAREEMANWKPGVAQERFVRPAFEKTKRGGRR